MASTAWRAVRYAQTLDRSAMPSKGLQVRYAFNKLLISQFQHCFFEAGPLN